tara:strand:+ start:517 stop:669 length:153 start_codon:yes stop_codon:yes gene_type:complete
MAGKKSKPAKQSSVKNPKATKHPTKEESLSRVKESMNRIVEGNDPGYHLR